MAAYAFVPAMPEWSAAFFLVRRDQSVLSSKWAARVWACLSQVGWPLILTFKLRLAPLSSTARREQAQCAT